jgi:hypothetical protein
MRMLADTDQQVLPCPPGTLRTRASLGALVLLAVALTPVTAQEEADPRSASEATLERPTWVTGVEHCSTADPGVSQVDDTGIRGFRDGLFVCTMETNDPRLNGTKTVSPWQADVWGQPQDFELVQWMDGRIEIDGGTWEGRLTGVASMPEPGDIIVGWYRGTGDYSGLTYFEQITGAGPWTIQGLIFAGEPPMLEPSVE